MGEPFSHAHALWHTEDGDFQDMKLRGCSSDVKEDSAHYFDFVRGQKMKYESHVRLRG